VCRPALYGTCSSLMNQPVVYNGLPPSSNPLNQLEQALGYGVSVWEKIKLCTASDRSHLLSLIYLLEAHTEALFDLCMLSGIIHQLPCDIIKRLSGFYSNPEQSKQATKRGPSLSNTIQYPSISASDNISGNYYEVLPEYILDDDDYYLSIIQ
jgi:hypothetical protein